MKPLELQRRLWARVRAVEGKIGRDTRAFVRRFIEELRREGYEIGPGAERALSDYFEKVHKAISLGVRSAILGAATLVPRSMKSAFMEDMYQDAFSRRWPDGLTLSDRIWWWQDETRRGVTRILSDGIRMGESVNSLVYKIQYEIEKGAPFSTVTTDEIASWAKELMEIARSVIKNPKMRRQWQESVMRASQYVEELSREGSHAASKRLLNRLNEAVNSGKDELIDSAVSWFHYDRQLYLIKRVVRTEMATAHHRGIIKATEEDPDVIGYQWRLSPTHPRPDICDFYADVDFGLGRGVYPKDKVPRGKAHPQCMCMIVPRVRKVKERGSTDFKGFIEGLPGSKKREIMPVWAQELERAGVPLERLIRPDGMDFVARKEIKELLGEEGFGTLKKVGKALSERSWEDFEGHALKRKREGLIRNGRELNKRFEENLTHPKAILWGIVDKNSKVGRVYALNRTTQEVSIIGVGGKRVTWFPLERDGYDGFIKKMKSQVSRQSFKEIGTIKELCRKLQRK